MCAEILHVKETNEDNGTRLMIVIILTLFLINGTSNVMRWEEDVAVDGAPQRSDTTLLPTTLYRSRFLSDSSSFA